MRTFEEVQAWVDEHAREDGDGVVRLRAALKVGIISGPGARVAEAWLDEHENGARREREAEQADLARRSTAATELAAAASVDAARHAGVSARWAKIAAAIAILALLVSAWAPMRELVQSRLEQPAQATVHIAAPPVAAASRR